MGGRFMLNANIIFDDLVSKIKKNLIVLKIHLILIAVTSNQYLDSFTIYTRTTLHIRHYINM